MTITTNYGFVVFSEQLSEQLVTFGEVNATRHCFIGDFSEWTGDPGGWLGDELTVTATHGNIRVCFVDEAKGDCNTAKVRGFLGRLLRS